MKSVSRSISVTDVYVLQYILRQITPFTHMLDKFAAKPQILIFEGSNKWRSHEKERCAGH